MADGWSDEGCKSQTKKQPLLKKLLTVKQMKNYEDQDAKRFQRFQATPTAAATNHFSVFD